RDDANPGTTCRRLSDRALLLHSRHWPRGDPRRRAQRLPGDQGSDRLRRHRHDDRQPARRPDVPGARSAGAAQMNLWLLAWQRFLRDPVGVASATVVLAFVAVALASAFGWVAGDWASEVAVSYAPPRFAKVQRAEERAQEESKASAQPDFGIVDPIGKELAEVRASLSETLKDEARAGAVIFGADKWGRDVLKKAIKGTETSLVVGFAAASLATLLGTLFGAFAGYYGRWVDDLFNWLYSVFTSIPYLLLVLAVAAVLGQKGVLTVVLILGLTGWTGIFRLVRAEYLKHRVREYVLAADSVGAS